jgi:hypothetical protein
MVMAGQIGAGPQQQGPAPFFLNAWHRRRPVDKIDFAPGKEFTVKFPEIGYLVGFYINIKGTMNCGAGASLTDEGPWNLIKKLLVETREGSGELVNFTGYGAFMESMVRLSKGYRPDMAGTGATTPHPDEFAAGVANGNNTWNLWFYVPITVNRYMNRDVGVIDLQARGFKGTLKITTEAAANVVNNVGTGFTGTMAIYYEHLGVPDHYDENGNMVVEVPEMIRCKTVETIDFFSRAGQEVKVEIPQDGTLYHTIHEIVINNQRSDLIDYIKLEFIDEVTPQYIDRAWLRQIMREHYCTPFPVGVYAMDFFATTQEVGDGVTADVLDLTEVVLTEMRIKIPDGTVLGADGTNFIRTIRMFTQKMRVANNG